jgi:hypothetical protein
MPLEAFPEEPRLENTDVPSDCELIIEEEELGLLDTAPIELEIDEENALFACVELDEVT